MGRNVVRTAPRFDTLDDGAGGKRHHKQRYPQLEKDGIFWFKTALTARTAGQQHYINTICESDITLCHGPAGSGKTWIVTRLALEALAQNQVTRIVVTKPILEAGEEQKIGSLPGEIDSKILPYFRAILDCFEEHIGPTILKRLLDSNKIVFIPTAYLRGSSFSYTWIIADEAQNLSKKGIRLLMTRIGEGSTMVLNGDTDQIDLPRESDSGLKWAANALVGKSPRIGVVELADCDIQRHPLIELILSALR